MRESLRYPVLLVALSVFGCLAGCEHEEATGIPQGALRLGSVLGDTETAFRKAETVRVFDFPADHGAHPEYRSEWWYLTVMLEDPQGREYGVQFTIFRQALGLARDANPWRSGQIYLGHAAVTDVAAGEHRVAQRLGRGHPDLAGAGGSPFAVWLDGWRLQSRAPVADAPLSLDLEVATDADFAFALQLTAAKPITLQGDEGLSRKGEGQASYYYSISRLTARGTVTIDGTPHTVSGTAWFDREWSTSVLGPELEGWDWFAVHLDDETDVMAFRLRRKDGSRDPYDHGVVISADGTQRTLAPADFQLTPLGHWQDSDGVRWPVAWQLDLDGRRLFITALLDDQRMETALVYWEGITRVHDADGKRLGTGYLEMTGYQ